MIPEIFIRDFDYELPNDRIAQTALEPRDASKLLVYQDQVISDQQFHQLPDLLKDGMGLFYNDAKVIPARIFAKNEHNAHIEIFLLKPFQTEYFKALNSTQNCQWECLVGHKKKWKEDSILDLELTINNQNVKLQFSWVDRVKNTVQINWENAQFRFIELLTTIGEIPLPPYIKRVADQNDSTRYQTVYSHTEGSVAAPTAGLHFTEAVMQNIVKKNYTMTPLTLHVSAGTFLPVSVDKAEEHPMHEEYFSISLDALHKLRNTNYPIAVGTTTVRVLESLYWCAVKIKSNLENPFVIDKLDPYTLSDVISNKEEAIQILISYLNSKNLIEIGGVTSIMIMPSYEFKFIKGLITNFHQPKSTLLLLIAAFTNGHWKAIYQHALNNNYRFLSYGDSSLLLR